MATQTTLLSPLSPELKDFYDMNLLTRLLPRLVWSLWGQPRPMPRNQGQNVNFRRFNSLPIPSAALTEGVTPAGNALSVSQLTATPLQEGDFVEISDYLDFTAPDPVLMETGDLLAEQAADTFDQRCRDVIIAGTSVQYANGRAARVNLVAGDELNDDEIFKVVRTLQENKCRPITSILDASTGVGTKPVAGGYVAIISPAVLEQLKKAKAAGNSTFTPVHEYGSRPSILPHEVGSIDEVRFVLTNNPKVYSAASGDSPAGDVHSTLVFGQDFYGMIMPQGVEMIVKALGSSGTADPLNQRQTVAWKALYTAVILNQLCGVRIEHTLA